MRSWDLQKIDTIFSLSTYVPVSYTHLDVYKRQGLTVLEKTRRLTQLLCINNTEQDKYKSKLMQGKIKLTQSNRQIMPNTIN